MTDLKDLADDLSWRAHALRLALAGANAALSERDRAALNALATELADLADERLTLDANHGIAGNEADAVQWRARTLYDALIGIEIDRHDCGPIDAAQSLAFNTLKASEQLWIAIHAPEEAVAA